MGRIYILPISAPGPRRTPSSSPRPAEKQLTAIAKANKRIYIKIMDAIEQLAHDPRPHLVKKLQVSGGYRIIYTISIIRVVSRQEAYSP